MPPRTKKALYPAIREHRILPSGPTDSPGLLVGEAGGETEHWQRRPFAGKSGDVLNTYLKFVGNPRPNHRVTNIYPYWTGPGNPDPTPAQIEEFEHLLEIEILRLRPRVIGCLGLVAAQWFLGPEITLDATHGVPHWSPRAPDAIVLPMRHPAAGFYDPARAKECQDDVRMYAELLEEGKHERPTPPQMEFILSPDPPVSDGRRMALDTEGLEDRPWGCSWSYDGITCYVWIYDGRAPDLWGSIDFHNALHDLKILRAMGCDTARIDPHDSMVAAFVLQLEPQGLKPLSLRHLNLRMNDFEDLVRPYHARLAIGWLRRAAAFDYPKLRPILIADYKKHRERLYKPQSAGNRILSLLRSYDTAPEKTHLEKRWAEIGETGETELGTCGKIDLTTHYQGQVTMQMQKKGFGGFPDFSIFCVPTEPATRYSGMDAGATFTVTNRLQAKLAARNLTSVYEMDRAALPFVDRMQQVGLGVIPSELRLLEIELEAIREKARDSLQAIVGDRWFNPGSNDQVAHWLYDVRRLKILKKTKSGDDGSTSEGALKMLRGYNREDLEVGAFIESLDTYRESDKYLSTFVRVIFDLMVEGDWGWRIHPNFRVTRVISARLSSHEPNVLAFPTRTDLGRRIRKAFKAWAGYSLLSVDESQVELRFMAHLAKDRRMREAFEEGIDLHTLTASIIFNRDISTIGKDSAERYVAKTINFAVMYGISAVALLEQLFKAGIFTFDLAQCEGFIKEWFRIYGSVDRFLKKLWAEAAITGVVYDMWGRPCYVPNLNVNDRQMREAAQRLAGNFPVQSGAHGLVKSAEVMTHQWIEKRGWRDIVRPWLQIHDELLLEVKDEHVEEVKAMVKGFMVARQYLISVPLKADAKVAKTWGELK